MWQLLKILALSCAVAFAVQPVDAKEQGAVHGATGPKKASCPLDFMAAGDGQGAAKCPPVSDISAGLATSAAQRDALNKAGNPICPSACPKLIRKHWVTTYRECISQGTMIAVSGVYELECDD
jgi:hypothetical protein